MMSRTPLKVVVVDDSVTIRMMLKSALQAADINVVGLAKDPFEAREIIKRTNPDVVTLDVEMPGMNGLEFLQKIISLRPTPVVMVSSLTAAGTDTTLRALEIGAVDFIVKPMGSDQARFAETLREKVRGAAKVDVRFKRNSPPPQRVAALSHTSTSLVAIGASTGGVAALGALLERLPVGLPPTVIVQHMPEGYTARFAERLNSRTAHDVAEARDGETLSRGMVRIAPGSHHVEVMRRGAGIVTALRSGETVSGHRPSVDVLFSSVAKAIGGSALGVILTGMGRDGANGLLEMRKAGSFTIGEDETTCVAYGMPRVAYEIGAVCEKLPGDAIPKRMHESLTGMTRRAARAAN